MNKEECALYVSALYDNGKELLDRHIEDYDGDILLHVFVPDLVCTSLIECIRASDEEGLSRYCDCIEKMWREGDSEVLNVVEVSVLERLADDDIIWQTFGRHISDGFRSFINTDFIPRNTHWLNIAKLE